MGPTNPGPLAKPSLEQTEALAGDTPMLRLFALLELIASKDAFVTLQGLVEETGAPKPTVHRMLRQLEQGGLLIRQSDGRHYGSGARLRSLAENILLNATQYGARHAALRNLMDETGESCSVTALSGNEIICLDRVDTAEPLRFVQEPGTRMPVHCTASGKMILSQMSLGQRRKLLGNIPPARYTELTISDIAALEMELQDVRRNGYAVDNGEFVSGLICVAVLVPTNARRSNLSVTLQAPLVRLTPEKALRLVPAMTRAARIIGVIEAEGSVD